SVKSTFDFLFFFFIHMLTIVISTRSLHDALPILAADLTGDDGRGGDSLGLNGHGVEGVVVEVLDEEGVHAALCERRGILHRAVRSEEHTSELQSRENLVCRLLLEKKNIPHTYKTC